MVGRNWGSRRRKSHNHLFFMYMVYNNSWLLNTWNFESQFWGMTKISQCISIKCIATQLSELTISRFPDKLSQRISWRAIKLYFQHHPLFFTHMQICTRTHKHIPVHTHKPAKSFYKVISIESCELNSWLIDSIEQTDERFQEVPKLSNYLTKPIIYYDIENKEGIVHVTGNDGICKPF